MRHVRPNVSTVCVGLAASMGAFLLASGHQGKRYSLPNSRIMIHQPLGGAQGQAADIEIQVSDQDKKKKKNADGSLFVFHPLFCYFKPNSSINSLSVKNSVHSDFIFLNYLLLLLYFLATGERNPAPQILPQQLPFRIYWAEHGTDYFGHRQRFLYECTRGSRLWIN